jgi:GNAT superfamily N-acetyltransferase
MAAHDLPAPWYSIVAVPDSSPPQEDLTAWCDGTFRDRTRVRLPAGAPPPAPPSARLFALRYEVGSGALRFAQLRWGDSPSGDALWWVTLPQGEAMYAIAFDTADRAPGTVIGHEEFTPMPVRSDQQVGTMHWEPATGVVREIYVAPTRRREGIGARLGLFAFAWQELRRGPRLRAGSHYTELGHAMFGAFAPLDGSPPGLLAHYARQRPEIPDFVRPMTPEEKRVGVPDRNLYPDPA